MDYNPFHSELKDKRLIYVDSIELNNTIYLNFRLQPIDNPICPCCNRSYIVKNGTKKRQIKGNIFHGKSTIIIVKYNRYLCIEVEHDKQKIKDNIFSYGSGRRLSRLAVRPYHRRAAPRVLGFGHDAAPVLFRRDD